jgi:hypothetical protein
MSTAERLAFAEAAKAALVRILDLEPMAGRPNGLATWDDVLDYTAKLKGGHRLASANTARRGAQLADALSLPEATPWPQLLERVRQLAGTSTEATARERWASWRHLRGPGVTEVVT